jgi:hypothetical protein
LASSHLLVAEDMQATSCNMYSKRITKRNHIHKNVENTCTVHEESKGIVVHDAAIQYCCTFPVR